MALDYAKHSATGAETALTELKCRFFAHWNVVPGLSRQIQLGGEKKRSNEMIKTGRETACLLKTKPFRFSCCWLPRPGWRAILFRQVQPHGHGTPRRNFEGVCCQRDPSAYDCDWRSDALRISKTLSSNNRLNRLNILTLHSIHTASWGLFHGWRHCTAPWSSQEWFYGFMPGELKVGKRLQRLRP